MGGMEAFSLDRSIRIELHEHATWWGNDGIWRFGATELAEATRIGVVSVKHLDVVVSALMVRLKVKVIKNLKVKDKYNSNVSNDHSI